MSPPVLVDDGAPRDTPCADATVELRRLDPFRCDLTFNGLRAVIGPQNVVKPSQRAGCMVPKGAGSNGLRSASNLFFVPAENALKRRKGSDDRNEYSDGCNSGG
jgi:hypothetical protein